MNTPTDFGNREYSQEEIQELYNIANNLSDMEFIIYFNKLGAASGNHVYNVVMFHRLAYDRIRRICQDGKVGLDGKVKLAKC